MPSGASRATRECWGFGSPKETLGAPGCPRGTQNERDKKETHYKETKYDYKEL